MCIQFWCEIKGEFPAKRWIVSRDQEQQATEFQIVCSDQEKGAFDFAKVLSPGSVIQEALNFEVQGKAWG